MGVRVAAFGAVLVAALFAVSITGANGSPAPDRRAGPIDTTPPALDINVARFQKSARYLSGTASCDEPCSLKLRVWIVFPRRYLRDLPRGADTRRKRFLRYTAEVCQPNQSVWLGLAYGADSNETTLLRTIFAARDTTHLTFEVVAKDRSGNRTVSDLRRVKLGRGGAAMVRYFDTPPCFPV